jgi:hypothetical protein
LTAGDLLLEAKAQVGHGQWLRWLRDRCGVSDRIARLYMRLARNRQVSRGGLETLSSPRPQTDQAPFSLGLLAESPGVVDNHHPEMHKTPNQLRV